MNSNIEEVINENVVERRPRGRPRKNKDLVIVETIIKCKIGRPKIYLTEEERLESVRLYNKKYYEEVGRINSKGDILCPTCNLLISKSNKSRHNSTSYHLKNVEEKKQLFDEVMHSV